MLGNNAIGEDAIGASGAQSTDASATLMGVSATATVGTISANGGTASIPGSAALTGVAGSAAAGNVAASGGAGVSLSGAQAFATVGTVTASVGAQLATHVTVRVVDRFGEARPGLTGIKWAFFDQTTLNALRAPTAQGINGATDGAGYMTLPITGTALQPGQVGVLAFSNSSGDVAQAPPASSFLSPVTVA